MLWQKTWHDAAAGGEKQNHSEGQRPAAFPTRKVSFTGLQVELHLLLRFTETKTKGAFGLIVWRLCVYLLCERKSIFIRLYIWRLVGTFILVPEKNCQTCFMLSLMSLAIYMVYRRYCVCLYCLPHNVLVYFYFINYF